MIEIPVKTPFPWEQLLNYLSTRCIPGFEHLEGNCYHRLHNRKFLTIGYDRSQKQLRVGLDARVHDHHDIRRRITQLFYPSLSTTAIYRHLAQHLPFTQNHRGFRPPGCWEPFELCVRTIIGQQVSVAAAQTIMRRLLERCGDLSPQALLSANLDNMGMPGRRVQTLSRLAHAVIAGEIDFSWPWQRLDQALADLPGIGPWTRGYLAIRLGREMDAFPETDVGLIRAAGAQNAKDLLRQAEPWRPYRAYAAVCLWNL